MKTSKILAKKENDICMPLKNSTGTSQLLAVLVFLLNLLFTRIFFNKGSVVSFYNGIRLNTSSVLMEQRYGPSMYR